MNLALNRPIWSLSIINLKYCWIQFSHMFMKYIGFQSHFYFNVFFQFLYQSITGLIKCSPLFFLKGFVLFLSQIFEKNNELRHLCPAFPLGEVIGLAKKLFFFFFPVRWVQQCLVVFNVIRNNFVRLYCDSCHLSMHLKRNIKTGEFLCSHFNIEDERKYETFWHIMLYYFKKGKSTTEMQKKDLCSVRRRCCD